MKLFQAGENQDHILENVFNVLGNQGFLRDQGILTLESVQLFYEAIGQEPKVATLKTPNLLDICTELGSNELVHRPVITLTRSQNGKTSGHAVVVKRYERCEDCLNLTTLDSLSETGETLVKCPILEDRTLDLSQLVDKWCLASEKCYYFELN